MNKLYLILTFSAFSLIPSFTSYADLTEEQCTQRQNDQQRGTTCSAGYKGETFIRGNPDPNKEGLSDCGYRCVPQTEKDNSSPPDQLPPPAELPVRIYTAQR